MNTLQFIISEREIVGRGITLKPTCTARVERFIILCHSVVGYSSAIVKNVRFAFNHRQSNRKRNGTAIYSATAIIFNIPRKIIIFERNSIVSAQQRPRESDPNSVYPDGIFRLLYTGTNQTLFVNRFSESRLTRTAMDFINSRVAVTINAPSTNKH